jgi:hypothetical protein
LFKGPQLKTDKLYEKAVEVVFLIEFLQ